MIQTSIGTSDFTLASQPSRIPTNTQQIFHPGVAMKNETIKCPFCFTQSPHGVRICKGCHAKVAYGESPLSVAFLFQFVAFGLAWLAFSWTGSTLVSVLTFFISIIILIYKIKRTYADRVVFIR